MQKGRTPKGCFPGGTTLFRAPDHQPGIQLGVAPGKPRSPSPYRRNEWTWTRSLCGLLAENRIRIQSTSKKSTPLAERRTAQQSPTPAAGLPPGVRSVGCPSRPPGRSPAQDHRGHRPSSPRLRTSRRLLPTTTRRWSPARPPGRRRSRSSPTRGATAPRLRKGPRLSSTPAFGCAWSTTRSSSSTASRSAPAAPRPCSSPPYYVEDSLTPQTRITMGPASKTRKRKAIFRFKRHDRQRARNDLPLQVDRAGGSRASRPSTCASAAARSATSSASESDRPRRQRRARGRPSAASRSSRRRSESSAASGWPLARVELPPHGRPHRLRLRLGLVAGSFVTAVAHRVPRGISIAGARSQCPACGAQIAAYDNVPVSRGCSCAAAPAAAAHAISPRYPAHRAGARRRFSRSRRSSTRDSPAAKSRSTSSS